MAANEPIAKNLADLYAAVRRGRVGADGGFTHEFSAPSTAPPPWYVYEFTPEEAYAVMAKEPGGATRWTF